MHPLARPSRARLLPVVLALAEVVGLVCEPGGVGKKVAEPRGDVRRDAPPSAVALRREARVAFEVFMGAFGEVASQVVGPRSSAGAGPAWRRRRSKALRRSIVRVGGAATAGGLQHRMEVAASKYIAERLQAFILGFREHSKHHQAHRWVCVVLLLLHMLLALYPGGQMSPGSLANGVTFLQSWLVVVLLSVAAHSKSPACTRTLRIEKRLRPKSAAVAYSTVSDRSSRIPRSSPTMPRMSSRANRHRSAERLADSPRRESGPHDAERVDLFATRTPR